MVIDVKHKIGSIVYLLTDEDQLKRVVTEILVRSGNYTLYELSCGSEGLVYAASIEITKHKTYTT